MYPKLIITRSRCNLTMKLSETLSIKTQAVIYKANTFFVQRLSSKAYNVNSMKYCNQKMKRYLKCTQIFTVASCLQKTETPKDIKQIHLHPKTEHNSSNIIIHAKLWDYNTLTYTHASWQPLTHMTNVQCTDITHKVNPLKTKRKSA